MSEFANMLRRYWETRQPAEASLLEAEARQIAVEPAKREQLRCRHDRARDECPDCEAGEPWGIICPLCGSGNCHTNAYGDKVCRSCNHQWR